MPEIYNKRLPNTRKVHGKEYQPPQRIRNKKERNETAMQYFKHNDSELTKMNTSIAGISNTVTEINDYSEEISRLKHDTIAASCTKNMLLNENINVQCSEKICHGASSAEHCMYQKFTNSVEFSNKNHTTSTSLAEINFPDKTSSIQNEIEVMNENADDNNQIIKSVKLNSNNCIGSRIVSILERKCHKIIEKDEAPLVKNPSHHKNLKTTENEQYPNEQPEVVTQKILLPDFKDSARTSLPAQLPKENQWKCEIYNKLDDTSDFQDAYQWDDTLDATFHSVTSTIEGLQNVIETDLIGDMSLDNKALVLDNPSVPYLVPEEKMKLMIPCRSNARSTRANCSLCQRKIYMGI